MQIARVIGTIVATEKDPNLTGLRLYLVQPIDIVEGTDSGGTVAAVDTVGSGMGDVVMLVGGSSARQTRATSRSPVDMAIVGIIETVTVEGETVYKRS